MLTSPRRRSATSQPRLRMNELNSSPTQLRVIYRGHVQGVGFRYRTNAIAQRYPVTGFVMNRADGSVELVVAGAKGVVNRFLSEIDASMSDNISDKQVAPLEGLAEWPNFSIRR